MSQIGWTAEGFLLERMEGLPRFQQEEQKLEKDINLETQSINRL